MKPTAFDYVRPESLDEALALLADIDTSAKVIAGGQSLVPMMNFRTVTPDRLIDINGLTELQYVRVEADMLQVGALMRHADLLASEVIRENCPLMHEAYGFVAHHAVRNRGTLAGNLSHADPASEMPAVVLASDATLIVRSLRGTRRIPASDFFVGPLETELEDDEILVAISVPITRSLGWAFEEMSVRHGDFAMVGVAAKLGVDPGGVCHSAAIALCGVSGTPIRIPEAESFLNGKVFDDATASSVADIIRNGVDFTESPGVSSSYRAHVSGILTERALKTAHARAGGVA